MATYSNDKSWNRYTVSIGSLSETSGTQLYKDAFTVPDGAVAVVGRVHADWETSVHTNDGWQLNWKRVQIDGSGTTGYSESNVGAGNHGNNCPGRANAVDGSDIGSSFNAHPLTRVTDLTEVEVGGSGDQLVINYFSSSGSQYLTGFWVEYWLYE